ncbi:serine/threonine protein kinase [Paenibacillus sp. cl141a]|uniref:protein kinase family protein n=1 Tax=Paenibacillus sp. cl141a TaxID=1761877 RepID=UPI0008B81B4A|nr:protein kinase family protein [Paenibacillus sp. cl141a]SEL55669.1 serine/threonine protein kinase [Paenibacillus sp. cl141a]
MLVPGELVKFDSMKNFRYISPLGSGGTGDAHLFKDETTDMLFAFKKYAPKDGNNSDDTYRRFVDEIKILFNISHNNIVRVYNYYLYSEAKTGYLQMEYVEGIAIHEFEPSFWKDWEDIFKEVIYAFEYLEEKNILHRDIRPANILIDKNENVKIIDFGFGKRLEFEETGGESVFLNWPVTQWPNETQLEGIYNHQSEIYFIGKLFQNILRAKGELERFKFNHILDKMTKLEQYERYASFNDISQAISEGVISEIDFSGTEKDTYKKFADALVSHISYYNDKYEPINDIDSILNKLGTLIRSSSLEAFIQDNSQLIRCFIKGSYVYNKRCDIEVQHVKNFYQLLVRLDPYKQKIVLDNIQTRLGGVKINITDDDLPF